MRAGTGALGLVGCTGGWACAVSKGCCPKSLTHFLEPGELRTCACGLSPWGPARFQQGRRQAISSQYLVNANTHSAHNQAVKLGNSQGPQALCPPLPSPRAQPPLCLHWIQAWCFGPDSDCFPLKTLVLPLAGG